MKIVLIGMKGSGKTTLGSLLAERLHIPFLDSDTEIEKLHAQERGETLPFRQLFSHYGAAYFAALETRTLKHIAETFGTSNFVLACGGRTHLREENQEILGQLGQIFYLQVQKTVLLKRILAQGIPAFFPYPHDPEKSLDELLAERVPIYTRLADVTLDVSEGTPEELIQSLMKEVQDDA